ncbi:MAG: hypothetical protein HY646_04875, partial [Acidobacteria bacterium]|nr:hypothetical protein [Acidobacteriota bacterium]
MNKCCIVATCIVLFAMSSAPPASGQFSLLQLYDNFDAKHINPILWIVRAPGLNYELTVEQVRGRLKIESQGYGGTDTDSGVAETGRVIFGVPPAQASLINAVEATARVED